MKEMVTLGEQVISAINREMPFPLVYLDMGFIIPLCMIASQYRDSPAHRKAIPLLLSVPF